MNNPHMTKTKIKKSEHIYALKIKTESNGLGGMKTLIVISLIALQLAFIVVSNLYFLQFFRWYLGFSIILSLINCVYVLSSDYNGQAKATWILFLLACFGFGYIVYLLSDRHILFAKSRKKYAKIFEKNANLQSQISLETIKNEEVKTNCNYLFNAGKFKVSTNTLTQYYSSGTQLFDAILEDLEKAKEFIFIEFFIISDGVLLNRFLDILKQKVAEGVDVRIIYDDMGSHSTMKRKTKEKIKKAGIKLQTFNRLVPVFNIALNLRDHRKIVVIDGKISYTGGANLADEYVNEKRMYGYWKDCGIRLEGEATDNFTIAFLSQWEFLTNCQIDYSVYLSKAEKYNSNGVVVPFVSGPNYDFSIAQNIYVNEIANAKEKLYIMTPYFVPDETLTKLIINKARSGVDVRIILPEIADKKFVYIVSRNNAEKLLTAGVKVYTMTTSFVHSKVVMSENSAIVGSINMDLRSFNQQFESAVFLNEKSTLLDIETDFNKTFDISKEINIKTRKLNKLSYRILAGIFNLISPFM